MYRGVITAPKKALNEIRSAGFRIYEIRDTVSEGISDFIVEGPDESLDNINDNWGSWVWSLDQIGERTCSD